MSSSPDKRLWAGHCWLCGTRCFDVLDVYSRDHPFAGQPRRFGRPCEGAKRVTFVRARSGHMTDLTLCGGCEPEPERMHELSATLNLRARIDDSPWWREASGADRVNPDTERHKLLRLRTAAALHSDPILGEIARRPLDEVL